MQAQMAAGQLNQQASMYAQQAAVGLGGQNQGAN